MTPLKFDASEERERLLLLEEELEAAGLITRPRPSEVRAMSPILIALAAALLGGGLGLTAILIMHFTVLLVL